MNFYDWITQTTIVGNELWRIGLLFLILLTAFTAGKLVSFFLMSGANRRQSNKKNIAAAAFRSLASASSMISLVVGLEVILSMQVLVLGDGIQGFAYTMTSLLFVVTIAWLAYRMVDVVDQWLRGLAGSTGSKVDTMLVPLVRKSLRITIIILSGMQIATLLSDKPLTSLIAGLGIGSVAIALGAQDTLKHFFGSIMILADKPFELGDRIVVGEHDGQVQEIGFRSTRIRTLDGHMVTVPNSTMASGCIKNIGQRPYIKRLFTLSVTYDTSPEKLQIALDIIKDILKDHEGFNADFPPRVYFEGFGDCSFNILVIYWYHPPNYWDFMVFNEQVNTEILKRFNEAGIDFAFPSRTLYLAGDSKRPLNIGSLSESNL